MSNAQDEPSDRGAVSSHRLPTVSASQALRFTAPAEASTITFGLNSLDEALSNIEQGAGLQRGRVAELYGPPGVGKTYLCAQVAASVIVRGGTVIWIDCGSQLAPTCLQSIIAQKATENYEVTRSHDENSNLEMQAIRFIHYRLPSLAHFLALVAQPPASFPSQGTEVIVIDSLATLVDVAYPRNSTEKQYVKSSEARWSSDRRGNIVAEIANALRKLAASKHVAILVTNYVVTQIRGNALSALLKPALSTNEWESTITTRILLFRSWASASKENKLSQRSHQKAARFAKIIKTGGIIHIEGKNGDPIAFEIDDGGVHELNGVRLMHHALHMDAVVPSKRSHDDVGDEDAETSDNEYGWTEEDVQLAAEGLVDERFLTARDVQTTMEVPSATLSDATQASNADNKD